MRIGELARRTGVGARSLRYYEEQGLLRSVRSDSAQRHYSEAEVERVSVIRTLFDAGLSSRVIATVLPCVETTTPPSPRTRSRRWSANASGSTPRSRT